MEKFEEMLDSISSIRDSMVRLKVHKVRLETALRDRGFMIVVENIRNEILEQLPCNRVIYEEDEDFANLFFGNQQPLVLEDIVKTLSRYLDYETLQTTRMVHSSWNRAIVTKRYLQNTKLVIRLVNWDFWEFKNLIDAFPFENNERVKVPTTVSLPNLGFVTDPEPLTTWFRVYGPRFTRLEIGEDDDDLEEELDSYTLKSRTFMRWLTELLPNLKELQIDNFDFRGRLFSNKVQPMKNLKLLEIGCGNRRNLGDPHSIKQFVECTNRNLETLRLWLRPKQQVQYLQICLETGHLRNLTALDLSEFKLTYPTLQVLTSVDFVSLKRFIFKLETTTRDQEVQVCNEFAILLDNVRDILEQLTGGLARDLFRFPEMQKLKKLESYIYDSSHTRSIDLLAFFPELETLSLEAAKDMGIDDVEDHCLIFRKLFPPGLRFENNSLKKLELHNFPFDQEAIGRLTAALPGIEIFYLGCFDRRMFGNFGNAIWSLDQLFKDLKNLKKLVDLTLSLRRTFGWSAEEFNNGISQGISKLQALKKCSMNFGDRFPVTEEAFTNGFMKSSSLQRLELRRFVIGSEIRPQVDTLRNKNVEVELLEWFSSSNDPFPVIYCNWK